MQARNRKDYPEYIEGYVKRQSQAPTKGATEYFNEQLEQDNQDLIRDIAHNGRIVMEVADA